MLSARLPHAAAPSLALPTAGLAGSSIRLRPFAISDLQDVHAWASDPQVSRYMYWSNHESLQKTEEYLHATCQQYQQPGPRSWAVTLKDDPRAIGSAGFHSWSAGHARAELACALSRRYWGRGLMTQVLQLLCQLSFEAGIERVEATCDARNHQAKRLLEKVSFTREGLLRGYVRSAEGSRIDIELYARFEHTG